MAAWSLHQFYTNSCLSFCGPKSSTHRTQVCIGLHASLHQFTRQFTAVHGHKLSLHPFAPVYKTVYNSLNTGVSAGLHQFTHRSCTPATERPHEITPPPAHTQARRPLGAFVRCIARDHTTTCGGVVSGVVCVITLSIITHMHTHMRPETEPPPACACARSRVRGRACFTPARESACFRARKRVLVFLGRVRTFEMNSILNFITF